MNRNDVKDWFIGWLIFSVIIFVAFYIIGFITVWIYTDLWFFSLPENAHFTEYNTPHAINNAIMIGAFHHPLTFWIAMLPTLAWTIILQVLFIRAWWNDRKYESREESWYSTG